MEQMGQLQLWDNPVRRQVYSIPAMVEEMLPGLQADAGALAQRLEKPRRVLISGCGDCFFAAMSMKETLSGWLGLPVEVVSSLELARHLPHSAVEEPVLVLLLSKSGGAARVVEAAQRMAAWKVPVVALTAKPESPLAQAAEHLLQLRIPAFESAPGVRSYTAMMLGLSVLGAALSQSWGVGGMEPARCAEGLGQALHLLEGCLSQWDQLAFDLARLKSNARSAELIGGGIDAGAAWYTGAKFYETAGLPASCVDCEDWFHLNYFAAPRAEMLTMVFHHQASASASRSRELLTRLEAMGFDVALVTDEPQLPARWTFSYPHTEEWTVPMITYAAGALVASYVAKLADRPFNCGFAGPWAKNPQLPNTANSEIQILTCGGNKE